MGVESKIRELMEGAANRPKDKQQGDASSPAQGSSDANPEIQDLSGTGNKEGGLTAEVGKKAADKESKDTTLPKGAGAKEAPANFETKKEEVESEEEAIVEDEVVTDEVIAEDEVVAETEEAEEIAEEEEVEIEEEYTNSDFLKVSKRVKVKSTGATGEVVGRYRHDNGDIHFTVRHDGGNTSKHPGSNLKVHKEEVVEETTLFEADLNALFADEEHLTEEFKVKAAEVFEAVVTSRVTAEIVQIEEELTEAANKEFESQMEQMVENIDKYLGYVTENWMTDNQIAIESGIRTEVTESFIKGLQQVFTEHYIDVPEEKYDVMTEMQQQIDSLTAKLDEEVESKMSAEHEAITLKKQAAFANISEDLASTEKEKFATLVEDITYTGMDSYEQKLQVVKENYFPKEVVSEDKLEDTFEATNEVTNTVMSKYAQAISKTTKFN